VRESVASPVRVWLNMWWNVDAGCCIYEKPRIFGQSDDESDDDDGGDEHGCTERCRGHGMKDYRKSTDNASSSGPKKDSSAGPPRDIGVNKWW